MGDLVRYEAACRAIAEAKTVDEAKDIRDEFKARQAYARQARNRELEADCVEIRMRATRRIDALVKAQAATVGLNKGGPKPKKLTGVMATPVTLEEVGIDKNLAKEARALGALDDATFEAAITDAKAAVNRAVKNVVRAKVIEAERQPYVNDIQEGCTVDDLAALAASGYRAGVIYADPPWSFEVYSGKGKSRSADRHYDTMSLDDIKAMGPTIQALAADDCALFLWSVCPELPGALDVIEAWGFEYKTTGFVWIKTTAADQPATGMGYWTRANAEPCLLATRGNPVRIAKDVHQVVTAPRGEHSEKPDEVYHRIERLVGGPYLELFARKIRPGWRCWGNQIKRADLFEAAE